MFSTVLIIDRRKELSTKYKKCIDSLDVNAVVAMTLNKAIVALRDLEPDLIIISDSIEEDLSSFCQKVRALTYNTRPVIVALSKSAESIDRIKVLENGADDFLSEPVNMDEFKTRVKAHLRRDFESNLDTKTLLPNNRYVRKALKRALVIENQAVLIAGIENLNNYKSVYTEVAADKLLQTFVAIAKSALGETDFIGQLDDTNFIIVTNKFNIEKLAEFLTFAFDTVVPKFYSQQDAERGYSLMKGERYAGMRVELVSVLLGGIIDGFNLINSVDALISRLISVKKLAKTPSGSNYIIERTQLAGADSIVNMSIAKTVYINEKDESLNYLIRTALELQGYDVQERFDKDSAVQPSVMIVDAQTDLSGLEFLRELRTNRNFADTKFIITSTTHDKSQVLNAGADLYLPKPYEISDLIRWVEYFMH